MCFPKICQKRSIEVAFPVMRRRSLAPKSRLPHFTRSMAAERPRRFAAQVPASPAKVSRAEAQIEQAAAERVNLSAYPKDHPIWQDSHFCPDGPDAMFPDAEEAFAAAAASLGFTTQDGDEENMTQEDGRDTSEAGRDASSEPFSDNGWATIAALAGTPLAAGGTAMSTPSTSAKPSVAFAIDTPVGLPDLDAMMNTPVMDGSKDRVRWTPEEDELIIRMRVHGDRSIDWNTIAAATGRSKQSAKNRWQYVLKKRYPEVPGGRVHGI